MILHTGSIEHTRDYVDRARIWEAAFAAAYVAEFREAKAYWSEQPGNENAFDRAVESTTAEVAWTVADNAVAEYDRWLRENHR